MIAERDLERRSVEAESAPYPEGVRLGIPLVISVPRPVPNFDDLVSARSIEHLLVAILVDIAHEYAR